MRQRANPEIIKTTIREQVAAVLRRKILSGEFRQGEHIVEADLAYTLNISRGPIREALRQIEEEGLITYVPHKGCVVKTLSYKDMQEGYLIRSTLETLAVKIYSAELSDKTIDKMEAIIQNIDKAANKRDLYKLTIEDEAFHSCIVEEAGCERLFRIWKSMEGSNAAAYYTMEKETLMPFEVVGSNHRLLLDAFRTEDLEKVCSVIEEHYMVVPKELYKKKPN